MPTGNASLDISSSNFDEGEVSVIDLWINNGHLESKDIFAREQAKSGNNQ